MQIAPLSWQDLTIQPTFSDKVQPETFLDFQPNARQALHQFLLKENGASLVLKTEVFPEFIDEISRFLTQNQAEIIVKTEINRQSLFGYSLFLEKEQKIKSVEGAIQQANNKILILNLNDLLLDITQWDKLKQALLFGEYQPHYANVTPIALPIIKSNFKLLLLGSRDDISALASYDNTLYQFSQYSEIHSYLRLENNEHQWGNYIQTLSKHYLGHYLSHNALTQFFRAFIRESESQQLISISPTLIKKQLLSIRAFYPEQQKLTDIQAYFDAQEQQSACLHQYALDDILQQQLHVETDGEAIGQINGLSVVEFDGVPHAFGEPLRMSCNVQFGDGEIHDIERKVELAGNIHAKGILIAQSCLANLLELPTQLPFSANLAFEQSYGDIDGDSSALAIFSVLMSALTQLPLPQSLAVTGTIDQFGNVLSVGGVTAKIEGFYQLCVARGLTGKQGVIIPQACLLHLSLHPDVLQAIKTEQFHIWAVEDVFEALQILLARPFFDDENAEENSIESLFTLAHNAIDEHNNDATSGSFWQKICKVFKRD